MKGWSELVEYGLIARLPTETERRAIGKVDGLDWDVDLPRINGKHPELLTAAGKDYLQAAAADTVAMWGEINGDRDQANSMGRHAPKINLERSITEQAGQDGSITEKQLAYLVNLGVRDQDEIIKRFSKKLASELIAMVIELRESKGLPT